MSFDTEILYGKDRQQNLARETPFARKSGQKSRLEMENQRKIENLYLILEKNDSLKISACVMKKQMRQKRLRDRKYDQHQGLIYRSHNNQFVDVMNPQETKMNSFYQPAHQNQQIQVLNFEQQ